MKDEKRKISGILIDVKNGVAKPYEMIDDLDEIYKVIDCQLIDIVYRGIGGKPFTIICDDEGLLKDSPIVSAVDKEDKPMLVGNLFICSPENDNGDLVSLAKEEAEHILKHIAVASEIQDGGVRLYPVLIDVEY